MRQYLKNSGYYYQDTITTTTTTAIATTTIPITAANKRKGPHVSSHIILKKGNWTLENTVMCLIIGFSFNMADSKMY